MTSHTLSIPGWSASVRDNRIQVNGIWFTLDHPVTEQDVKNFNTITLMAFRSGQYVQVGKLKAALEVI